VAWNTASSPTRYGNNIVFSDIIDIGSAVIIGQTVQFRLSVFDEIGSSVQISVKFFVQLEPLYP
jgi:acyl-CoA hydrolase